MKLLTDPITGTSQPRNIAAYLREPVIALEYLTSVVNPVGDVYSYTRIWTGTYSIVTGDKIVYDVWVDPMSVLDGFNGIGAVDIAITTAPSYGRGTLFDTAGIGINLFNPALRGGWNTRVISLTPFNGKTMSGFDLVNEGDLAGNSRALYRNIRITDANLAVKQVIWKKDLVASTSTLSGGTTFEISVLPLWTYEEGTPPIISYEATNWRGDPYLSSFNFGTDVGLRNGIWHDAGMSVFPDLTSSSGNDFGIQSGGGFDIELAINPREFAPAIEFNVEMLGSNSLCYVFWAIWGGTYTIQSGDVLRFLVWTDPKNPSGTNSDSYGVELDFSTPSPLYGREVSPPLRSQYNTGEFVNDNPRSFRGRWVEHHVKLDGDSVGKVINYINLFSEGEGVGNYRFLFRNIRITDNTQSSLRVSIAQGAHVLGYNAYRYGSAYQNATVVTVDAPIPLTVDDVSNKVIEMCNTVVVGGGAYVYEYIWSGSVALSSGDLIQFDYWIDPSCPPLNASESGGVTVMHSIGGYTNAHYTTSRPRGVWLSESWPINGGSSGGTMSYISVVNESDAAGNHRVLYRNIRVTDSVGVDKLVAWRNGNLAVNTLQFSALQTVYGVNVIDQRLETQAEQFDYSVMVMNPQPWLGRQFDLELVSTLNKNGLPTQEIVDIRRAVAKAVSRRYNALRISFVDIDMAALQKTYPSTTFVTSDHAALLPTDVGKTISDGVGQLVKVPMTFISTSGGIYYYAICESRAGMTYTLQTVYRGESAGVVGRIVSSTEYSALAETGAYPSGIKYRYIGFPREQISFNGQPYILTADILVNSGSGVTEARLASNEIKRLLTLCGSTTDDASFAAVAAYGVTNQMYCDAGYVKARTFKAIIEDLLMICRCDLSKLSSGVWTLIQDSPRASLASFREDSDEIRVDDYSFVDKPSKVSLYYRPEVSGEEKWNVVPRTRTPGTLLPEKRYQNPYIRDHVVADRLCDYLSKRDSLQQHATISINAVQMDLREVFDVTGTASWFGTKQWMIDSVRRPADKNILSVRQYNAAIYTYSSVTLPTDTSGAYSPDYSSTPPLAPTALSVVDSATAVDSSGKALSWVKFRATPPALNWTDLFASIQNLTTLEISLSDKLTLTAGVYSVVVGRLQPDTAHRITVWAINSNNIRGATATLNHTTGAYSGAPPTPNWLTLTQLTGRSVEAVLANPTYPHHSQVEWLRRPSAGSYSPVGGSSTPRLVDTNGLSYGTIYFYKARFVDLSGNVGPYSSEQSLLVEVRIDDSHIIGSGVSGSSIANGAINRGRTTNTNGSGSGSISALDVITVGTGGNPYTFWVNMGVSASGATPWPSPDYCGVNGQPYNDQCLFSIRNNNTAAQTWYINYRYINP